MRILTSVVLLLTMTALCGQNFSTKDPDYIRNVQLGEKALGNEKFDSCLVYYETAFEIKQTSVLSTLRMVACAFSGGKKEVYDEQMGILFGLDGDDPKHLFNVYEEFEYLKGSAFDTEISKRWKEKMRELGLDVGLIEEFDEIARTDQAQRREMRPISEKYGWDSPQMDSLWKIQNYSDSVNTLRISEILDKDGYPGKSTVGSGHQGTAFLVIQHAAQEVQEKYLPLIKAAAEAGEVRWSSVALLIDRVRQGQGKKQIYGSQVSRDPNTSEYYFGEIEEPYKVDSIRASVGLGPLNDYAKNWEFSYDPAKHIERYKQKKKSE